MPTDSKYDVHDPGFAIKAGLVMTVRHLHAATERLKKGHNRKAKAEIRKAFGYVFWLSDIVNGLGYLSLPEGFLEAIEGKTKAPKLHLVKSEQPSEGAEAPVERPIHPVLQP
jgi:hypothetical protein